MVEVLQSAPGGSVASEPVRLERGPIWRVETAAGPVEARSASAVLYDVERGVQEGRLRPFEAIPTGFAMLDHRMGGGFRLGDLVLIGGAQGVGKTTMALQMARNIAAANQATCVYVCFEHDEVNLIQRLIAQESIDPAGDGFQVGLRVRDIQNRVLDARKRLGVGMFEALSGEPRGEQALRRLRTYADSLLLTRGSDLRTTLDALSALVEKHSSPANGRVVLFIDYLQRVPVYPEPPDEAEKVTKIVEGLKSIALSQDIVVVSVVAADKEGLKSKRLRLHHLRGSSALTYEADVVLILNEKYRIISKTHIEFNPHKAQSYRDWLICSVEKNRNGRDQIDVEFEKRFDYCCLDPRGADVHEVLIEERIYTE